MKKCWLIPIILLAGMVPPAVTLALMFLLGPNVLVMLTGSFCLAATGLVIFELLFANRSRRRLRRLLRVAAGLGSGLIGLALFCRIHELGQLNRAVSLSLSLTMTTTAVYLFVRARRETRLAKFWYSFARICIALAIFMIALTVIDAPLVINCGYLLSAYTLLELLIIRMTKTSPARDKQTE